MPEATITILLDEPIGTISPLLHGQFAEHLGRCCNDGLWVGDASPIPSAGGLRSDVLAALRDLAVPMLRWPGGCYADTYHWRDGIGPRETRPRTLGESCGLRVVEDNGLGTHEFLALCRAMGAEPYLAGNVGTGTPREMMQWVEYCNSTLDTNLVRERAANGHPEPMRVRYWGVGNENWGCGGNYDAVDYAKEYRRYATFLRMADPDAELVACGHNDRDWNLGLIETLRDDLRFLDHLSVHQYYKAGPATGFSDEDYYRSMRAGDLVEYLLQYTDEVLRFFVAGRRKVGIALDEWGIWHPEAARTCDYEAPNTLRDAVAAAGVLDTLHRWCDRVSMANLAQIVNVLQCLIQTDGGSMWLTPTYHLFQLYRPHRGATALRCLVDAPSVEAGSLDALQPGTVPLVSACASQRDGRLIISLTNRSLDAVAEVRLAFRGARCADGMLLSLEGPSPDAVNSAADPDVVRLASADLGGGTEHRLTLPACSVHTASLVLA